jgi:hypothetical protein
VFTIGPGNARELIEASVTAISVLGGAMAYCSGYFASQAASEEQPPEVLGQRVNEGLAQGFSWGWPTAIVALIITIWM